MGSSFRVLLLSVGVVVAGGSAVPGLAQSVPEDASLAQSPSSPALSAQDSPEVSSISPSVIASQAAATTFLQATTAKLPRQAQRPTSSRWAVGRSVNQVLGTVPLAIALEPLLTKTPLTKTPLTKTLASTPVLVTDAAAKDGKVAPLPAKDSDALQRSLSTPAVSTPAVSTPAATPAPAPAATPTPLQSGTTPLPGTPALPTVSPPDPAIQVISPAPPKSGPIGPAKPGAAPEYLNSPANPLYFPTKPEEVKVQGIQPISLKQAIELAERNTLTLKEQKLQLESSLAALREAKAANFPTVNFQAGITHQRTASGQLAQEAQDAANANSLFPSTTKQDVATTNLSGSLTLSYDVFTSGLRSAQIKAAERQARAAELAVETALEQLRLDVTGAYYDLQQADESVRINAAAVRNAQISLKDAQALERAGLGTRFDVLRSQVQLANSQQTLTNAKSSQRNTRRELARRLSLAPTIDLAAADPVQVAGTWELSLENSIVLAYKNRSELQGQLALREAAQQSRRAALAALGPRLSVSAAYNFLDSYNDNFGIADGYSLQAVVNWSLFDGGAARAKADQQEVNVKLAETRFAEARDQARFDVEQAYSNLRSSFENIQTTTTALEQATEALRLARLRFQAGVGTQTDVINAETDLTTAEGNKVTAILGYNRALAQLQRAISNLPAIASSGAPSGAPSGITP